jgi:hypothetical protein
MLILMREHMDVSSGVTVPLVETIAAGCRF